MLVVSGREINTNQENVLFFCCISLHLSLNISISPCNQLYPESFWNECTTSHRSFTHSELNSIRAWVSHSSCGVLQRDTGGIWGGRTWENVRNFLMKALHMLRGWPCMQLRGQMCVCVCVLVGRLLMFKMYDVTSFNGGVYSNTEALKHRTLSSLYSIVEAEHVCHCIKWCVIPAFSTFSSHRCRFWNGWRRRCSRLRSTCCPLITSVGSATLGRCPLTPASRKSRWPSVAQRLTLR